MVKIIPTRNEDETTDSTTPVSRRQVVRGIAATGGTLVAGGVVGGTVTASQDTGRFNDASGRGGQAVVPVTDYREQPFEITARSVDSTEEVGQVPESAVEFQCRGGGTTILLIGWRFEYLDESDPVERTLYTRSNNIDTDKVFTWKSLDSGAKRCEDAVEDPATGTTLDFVQSSYRAVGPQNVRSN